MHVSPAPLMIAMLAICCAPGWTVEVQPVETPPVPPLDDLDDIDRLATVDDIVERIPPLAEPLGADLPVMLWQSGAPDPAGRDALEVERLLQERGLCVPPNIGKANDEELDEIARIIDFRREQGWATPVLAQTWGQVAFRPPRVPAHDPPASQDSHEYPCIARYEEPLLAEKARVEAKLDAMVERGIEPDIVLMDWEIWYRMIWASDGSGLADDLEQARACPICSERLPEEYLASELDLMRGLEILRGEIMRRAFVEPVKARFPDTQIGNYFSTSHVPSDQPLTDCHRVVGWWGGGADFSQPRAYGNFWKYHRSPELVGWNVLWQNLSEFSQMARNQVGDEYQIPWSCRLLRYEAEEPFERRTIDVWSWPRESYREYLRHVLLRGARGICVFKPNGEREGNLLMYLSELQDVQGAFAEMRRYTDILREGEPLNIAAPPGEAYSAEGAVVWSGMATDDRAIVRAVSFTGEPEEVTVGVFGETVALGAPCEGRTYLLTR